MPVLASRLVVVSSDKLLQNHQDNSASLLRKDTVFSIHSNPPKLLAVSIDCQPSELIVVSLLVEKTPVLISQTI